MGTTKVDEFTKKQLRMAELTKAMAHPARIAILEFMIDKQQCICGDIVNEIPLTQSTVSQHLKVLKDVGLIKGDTEGNTVCYCIREKTWSEAQVLLNSLFYLYKKESDCCPDKR